MKPREPRRKVLIKARIRVAESWGDAVILNMSSRGLMLQSKQPPKRGTYVELRRGSHVIIARAIWADSDRVGLLAQDPIPIDSVIAEPDRSGETVAPAVPATADRRESVGRRSSAERHEHSRRVARFAEFACLACLGATVATFAFVAVSDGLARPLRVVTASLE